MSPQVLKLLVGVTAVLPLIIAMAALGISEKTEKIRNLHIAVRVLAPLVWLVSIVALYKYWSFFNTWQLQHNQDADIDVVIIACVVVMHVLSASFVFAAVTDKVTSPQPKEE